MAELRTARRLLPIVLTLIFVCACGDGPTAPTSDDIEVLTAVPQAGTALTLGERVSFTVRARCAVATYDDAFAVLQFFYLTDTVHLVPDGTSARIPLTRGQTSAVTLSHTIVVPADARNVVVVVAIGTGNRLSGTDQQLDYGVR